MRSICSRATLGMATLCLAALPATALAAESVVSVRPAQAESLGVKTQVVSTDNTSTSGRYPATVLVPGGQQRVVAAPLSGLVEALRASVGDTVRAGQVLAILRSSQAQELQHDVHVSRSQAALASATLSRDELLFKEGLIASARIEASRAQAGLAREQREERELALRNAGGSAAKEGGGLTLTAPITGVVLERQVVVGQRVDASVALYRLAILSPLWLEMQVPASDVHTVRIGDVVAVNGGAARGQVIAVGHSVDAASQTVLVRAELQAPPAGLRPGQSVEAQFDRKEAGLASVPSSAVLEEGGKRFVFIEDAPGQYRAQQVTLKSSGAGVASVQGLPVGGKVVVQGMASLKSLRAAQSQK
jgi:membrane fusion protein, heavy metal efflux system